MKKILILLDGAIAKSLLKRLVQIDTVHSSYDIVYMNDDIIPEDKPSNFTFYKFDPTSFSKLKLVMSTYTHHEALVVLSNKNDTQAVIENISNIAPSLYFSVYNEWDLKFDNEHIQDYNALDVLSNGLIERLPNIPITAKNIGLKQGEIMEIKIPFGSSYAYRYISSISQKKWKIFALYRNNILVNVKPSLILKPNDIILVVGEPKVLIQIYNVISKTYGHFPMPFGKNIYLFLNMFEQTHYDVINCAKKARDFTQRIKNSSLIIRITRPTTIALINEIKQITSSLDVTIEIDYHFCQISQILKEDKKQFDIGMVVTTSKLLKNREIYINLLDLKLPIFKVGSDNLSKVKNIVTLLNDVSHYEQLSPIVFDIASQLNYNINIINSDPIGDANRDELLEHLANLAKIFNIQIKTDTNHNNPISTLKSKKEILQILPIRRDMFGSNPFKFLTTNSDLLSYDIDYINQILIPIIEEEKGL